MFGKIFTTLLAATAVLSPLASAAVTNNKAVAISPAELIGLEHALTVVNAIPDDVLEAGDDETVAWLNDNADNIEATTTELAVPDDFKTDDGTMVVQDIWGVAKCVAAVANLLVSTAIPAAKLLRLKKIIQQLGGIRRAIELLFQNKGNIGNAIGLVRELFDILSGFGDVRSACF